MKEKVINFTNEKVKVVDNIYRLQEMKDAMTSSLNNCEKIIEEQKLLVDILKKSKYYNTTFKELITDTNSQIEKMLCQKLELKNRIIFLEEVLNDTKDENIKNTINKFILAIGMFK